MLKRYTSASNSFNRNVRWGLLALLFLYVQIMAYRMPWWSLATQTIQTGQQFLTAHPVLSPLLFIGLYAIANLCCLPVNTVLRVLSGVLFGLTGILYALIASTLGATLNYRMGYSLLRYNAFPIHQEKLHRIQHRLQQRPALSLLVLRCIPVFPAWLVSMAAGYLRYRTTWFMLISLIGFIPACCLYVYMGATGAQLMTSPTLPTVSSFMEKTEK
jgi:uncharacterized membrane protein YdjX (TVP38/TMEM64 family)